jgi:hypothetical protein
MSLPGVNEKRKQEAKDNDALHEKDQLTARYKR